MQDSLNVENTPARYHREHNVSGTTHSSHPAKFKVTQNKLGQIKTTQQHHSVYMYYIYIYMCIYIYIFIL